MVFDLYHKVNHKTFPIQYLLSRTYVPSYNITEKTWLCGMFSSQLCLCVAKICVSECMNHHCTLPWWRNWNWSRTYLYAYECSRVEIVSFGLYVGEMHLVWRVSSPNYKIECFPQKVSISWESKRSPIFRYLQPIQRQYTYFCSYMNITWKWATAFYLTLIQSRASTAFYFYRRGRRD